MPEYFELFPAAGKGIYGELDDDGVVSFAIAAGPDSPIRGTELFNLMMDQFGDRAKAIRGVWIKDRHGEPSVNIDKVNELTNLGIVLEEAVLHAWTVTRARKRGFASVGVTQEIKDDAGCYMKIEVLIVK